MNIYRIFIILVSFDRSHLGLQNDTKIIKIRYIFISRMHQKFLCPGGILLQDSIWQQIPVNVTGLGVVSNTAVMTMVTLILVTDRKLRESYRTQIA